MDNRPYINRETKETEYNERLLADRVGYYWQAELKKIDKVYSLDFAIYKGGKVQGWAECKCRNFAYNTYPTYMMSVKKLNACREYIETTRLKAFWIASYLGQDYWLDTQIVLDNAEKFEKQIGGTTKRSWSRDLEPMIYVPIELFKRF